MTLVSSPGNAQHHYSMSSPTKLRLSVATVPMLTLPVPGLEMPVRPVWPSILDPPIRYPIIAAMHRHPTPCHPDVLTALPGPIAWGPDVAGAGRGDHFDPGLWRSNFDAKI